MGRKTVNREKEALSKILEFEELAIRSSRGTPLDEKDYIPPEGFSIVKKYGENVKRIPLLHPEISGNEVSYFEVVKNRASRRSYSKEKPISLEVLSALLFWTTGKRAEIPAYTQKAFPLFFTPSSGGLQGVDVYVIVTRRNSDLPAGIYYYDKAEHELVVLCSPCSPSVWLPDGIYHQWFILDAPVLLLFVLNLKRGLWKYGLMYYQNGLVDAGIMAAQAHLTAQATGLDSCMVAGFDKRLFADKLMLEKGEIPVLLLTLGYRSEGHRASTTHLRLR